jgi:rhodanese-related sulfurtransferase
VEQLSEFILNNLLLFAALIGVLVMLIKAELDHQANKGVAVSVPAAVRLVNNNDDALIIDLRAENDYKSGHLKGAKNVPLKDFSSSIDKFSKYKHKPVLVYCNSGSTATRAIKMLKNAGFEKISNLEGGVAAWKEANMPLTKK